MKENERKCIKCGCSPAQDPNITLHRFPKPAKTNGVKCELWAKYCFPHDSWSSREYQNQLYSKHYMLCNKHFKKSSFSNDSGKRLRKSAAPDEECDKIVSPEPILEHSNESAQPIAGPSKTRQPLCKILTSTPVEECDKIASPEPILEDSNESEQLIAGSSKTRQPLCEILTNTPDEECHKITTSELVIFHQNVRSLNSNTAKKLEDVLEKYKCDILGLTEHWLSKDELKGVKIKKFKLVSSYCRSKPSTDTRNKRKIRTSGGSCLFVNKTLKAEENAEICKLSEYQICEISAVNIFALNLLIVCIYRKPGTKPATFFNCLKRLLYKISGSKVNCTIVGDINIDTLVASQVSKKLYDILRCYNFKNHVDFPTRVSFNRRVSTDTSTALDHIYMNFCSGNIEALAIETKISDHHGTCARVTFSNPRLPSVQTVQKYTNDSNLNFGSINWNVLSAEELADSIINIIINKIHSLMLSFNYYSLLQEKNENLPIRSYVRNLIDVSSEYNNKVILNITKTMWPNVNWKVEKTNKPRQVLVRSTNGCNFESELYLAPEIITFINKKVTNQMLTKDMIYNHIATNLLLSFANIISHSLQIIFRRCLREGVFPRLLKEVKVCHLYKGKGSKTDPRSYRQIALIPAIAKILEKGLTTRLTEHINTTNYLLSNRQYAHSRAGSPLLIRPYSVAGSSKMVRDVIESVLNARERKLEVSILFCDLSKALDVADHIKEKFKHYGIDDRTLDLLVAFMKNRKQNESEAGVLQVSSLSNLVFTLLLNDFPGYIKNVELFMYAHEVAIVITAPTLEELESELNETAELKFKWFQTNGLALNVSEIQFIQFNLRGGNRPPMSVTIQGRKIQQVALVTILGFQLDDRLQGNAYIDKLCSEVSTACFDLMTCVASDRNKPWTISIDETKACYIASVHRLLERGVKVWGHGADWERVFELQECAVQILAHEPPDTPARKYFKQFGILTLPCLLIYNVAIYVVRHMGEFAINSKYSNRLVPKKYGLKRLSKTVAGMGPDVYNRIPDGIKQARDIDTFKAELKSWLLDKSFYSYSEFLTDFKKRRIASKKSGNQVTADISHQGSTGNLHSS